jgi:hypothetical protein
MKHLMLFEGFRKTYGEKIPLKDFEAIQKGEEVLYLGTTYTVVDSNGSILKLKDAEGRTSTVNYNMFNQKGAIRDKSED